MFFFTDTATGANLNEDCRGQDETFADAYYTYPGASHRKSNTIKRNFWIPIAASMTEWSIHKFEIRAFGNELSFDK